jgi:hypothetical protein
MSFVNKFKKNYEDVIYSPSIKPSFLMETSLQHTRRKITASLTYIRVRGKVGRQEEQGGSKTLNALWSFSPSPYLSQLATNMCTFNSQESSGVSCNTYNQLL